MTSHRRIEHPAWVSGAIDSLCRTDELYREGRIPKCIEVRMFIAPARRLLSGVYGGSYRAIGFLLVAAIANTLSECRIAISHFWNVRILGKRLEEWLDGPLGDNDER